MVKNPEHFLVFASWFMYRALFFGTASTENKVGNRSEEVNERGGGPDSLGAIHAFGRALDDVSQSNELERKLRDAQNSNPPA